ncbi:hypothetical protein M5K25_013393 [Dendrobium thyrsiflorum]|uniref:Uncharacterized protein n=1 Tax=Dendrobium thyrsiflorum TaxID=117978 RepID=A0ABD0V095_DENTH
MIGNAEEFNEQSYLLSLMQNLPAFRYMRICNFAHNSNLHVAETDIFFASLLLITKACSGKLQIMVINMEYVY